jgi:hypothetical protein
MIGQEYNDSAVGPILQLGWDKPVITGKGATNHSKTNNNGKGGEKRKVKNAISSM